LRNIPALLFTFYFNFRGVTSVNVRNNPTKACRERKGSRRLNNPLLDPPFFIPRIAPVSYLAAAGKNLFCYTPPRSIDLIELFPISLSHEGRECPPQELGQGNRKLEMPSGGT